ncbi:uncharacterized protein B0I36DRAFT_323809 [Microdochium trichocladiopsis]|uniref:Uncharacterized protein n=1 Tax=Microdochium trichocladiopsis TaxID=1682393 RepID=A0A9P8Y9Y2_9PEZI|nr:uncharacterized protein B0I36DRAFT_323809 [Microdochium trichocladiopsis]KAH7031380.1 hypothetical protein B0I36DRAFT_323809 [Microdochium trichocladiopsis]
MLKAACDDVHGGASAWIYSRSRESRSYNGTNTDDHPLGSIYGMADTSSVCEGIFLCLPARCPTCACVARSRARTTGLTDRCTRPHHCSGREQRHTSTPPSAWVS